MEKPLRVLFLCTGNSARSQIGEALLRHLSRGRVEVFSAGRGVSRRAGLSKKHLDRPRALALWYFVR